MKVRLFPFLFAAAAALAFASSSFAQSAPDMELRAVRLEAPLKVDGHLDEAVYRTVASVTDLWQQEPVEGVPATEKTEFWVFFDRENFYVSFKCWESDMAGLVANEMRRDSNNVFQGDHVAFLIDTFFDRRNGVEFAI